VLTRVLVAINVIVYLWECATGVLANNVTLEAHGALFGPDVLAGEWWRIFTAAFMHFDNMHILFNMIALWSVGSFVEVIFGAPRMAIIYALSALGGGVAVTYFSPDVITLGASGAIFGLFGALAVAGLRLGQRGRQIMQQTTTIIVINLIVGLIPGSNISIVDHVGGLIVGTLCGIVLFRMPRPRVAEASEPAYAQRIDPRDDPGGETIEHPPLEANESQPQA
jgi:rhomboid protease GluP